MTHSPHHEPRPESEAPRTKLLSRKRVAWLVLKTLVAGIHVLPWLTQEVLPWVATEFQHHGCDVFL